MYYTEIVILLLHLFRFVCKQPPLACFYSKKIIIRAGDYSCCLLEFHFHPSLECAQTSLQPSIQSSTQLFFVSSRNAPAHKRFVFRFQRERLQQTTFSQQYLRNKMTIMLIYVMINGTRSEVLLCLFLKGSNTNANVEFLTFFLLRYL